jgi:hypothetical protein
MNTTPLGTPRGPRDPDLTFKGWVISLLVGIFLMTAYDTDAIYHAVQFIHGL